MKELIEKYEAAMSNLGEAHNLLAKIPLSSNDYQPISTLLAIAKIDLFEIYHAVKKMPQGGNDDRGVVTGDAQSDVAGSIASPTTEEGVRSKELWEALNALGDMWDQFCGGKWGHGCMSAGENCEEVLDKYGLLIHKGGYEAVVDWDKLNSMNPSSGITTPSSDANKVHNTGDK